MEENQTLVDTLNAQEHGLADVEASVSVSSGNVRMRPARAFGIVVVLGLATLMLRQVDSQLKQTSLETVGLESSLECMCTEISKNTALFRSGDFGKRGVCSTGSRGCCIGSANVYCGLDVEIPRCLPHQLCPAGNICPACGAPDGHCPCGVPPDQEVPSPSPSPSDNRACSEPQQDCRASKCCKAQNLNCFEKTSEWATCRYGCSPGVDYSEAPQWQQPWSCKMLDAVESVNDVPDCTQKYPNSCQADWIDHKNPIAEAFYCQSGDAVGGCRHGKEGPFHPGACAQQCFFSPLMVEMKIKIENGFQP